MNTQKKSAQNVANDYVSQKISVGCLWLVPHVAKSFIPTLNSVVPDKGLHIKDYSQLFSSCHIKSLAT